MQGLAWFIPGAELVRGERLVPGPAAEAGSRKVILRDLVDLSLRETVSWEHAIMTITEIVLVKFVFSHDSNRLEPVFKPGVDGSGRAFTFW